MRGIATFRPNSVIPPALMPVLPALPLTIFIRRSARTSRPTFALVAARQALEFRPFSQKISLRSGFKRPPLSLVNFAHEIFSQVLRKDQAREQQARRWKSAV
jgi:hypothetical protein